MSAPPRGYVRVRVGRCEAIVEAEHEEDARLLLLEGTFYEAAVRDLAARPLAGRGVAYAVTLPFSGDRAVVRHNRHGGLLAPLTRDLFLPPTRAPYELAIALHLRAAGVGTPEILMYGVTPAAGIFRRADVVTREIAPARDLGHYLMPEEAPDRRRQAWAATRDLLRSLNQAGARHHDLNVKNILLAGDEGGALVPYVLDVDRVEIATPDAASVRVGNAQRLIRSALKWRRERDAVVDERELASLGALIDLPH